MKKLTVITAIFLQISLLHSQTIDLMDTCTQKTLYFGAKIVFDDSAIDAIFLHSKQIINNVDSFWANNRAFYLTKQWQINYILDRTIVDSDQEFIQILIAKQIDEFSKICYRTERWIVHNMNSYFIVITIFYYYVSYYHVNRVVCMTFE